MTAAPQIARAPVEPVTAGGITVVVADRHVLMRRGLRLLLEQEDGVAVVGEASDLAAVVRQVAALRPGVLVIDMSMSNGSSIEVIGLLRREVSTTAIVVLTMEDSRVFAQAALDAGAVGFVLKQAADAELATAVRNAARGERFQSPRLSPGTA